MKLFTIGYGGRNPDDFVALLRSRGVRTVVDVRLVPERASMGAYTKAKTAEKGIQALLARAGIDYVSRKELGNPYKDDPDWKRKYADLMEREGRARVQPLRRIPGPFCLLCAEKRIEDCHRALIAEVLEAGGNDVEHIV